MFKGIINKNEFRRKELENQERFIQITDSEINAIKALSAEQYHIHHSKNKIQQLDSIDSTNVFKNKCKKFLNF